VHAAPPELVARYFDHGATSFPKPATVARAMARYVDEIGGTYGRAAYGQVQEASRIAFDARARLARLIGCADASRVVFTLNATHALNIAIQGLARPSGVALVSPVEHNSAMRPLVALAARTGLAIVTLPAAPDGRVVPEAIRVPEGACLAVVAHQSNVNGAIQPIAAIKRALGAVPLVVDAAQSAGEIPLEVDRIAVDAVALSGHKHLLGPTGTGALYVREGLALPALMPGGTGSRSDSFEQPDAMPDALEAGTPNLAGLAGLAAALEFLAAHGGGDGPRLALRAIAALESIPGVRVLKAASAEHQGGLFSFCVDGVAPSEIARRLYERHRLAVRAGLHCAPAAHRALGTLERGGAVRIAFGRFHGDGAVARIADAITDAVKRP
jgi:selenocysteine lyase/cysteine desulfurase